MVEVASGNTQGNWGQWSGAHPKRFKIRRWEEQVAELHGEDYSESIVENIGWLLKAKDRDWWHKASTISPL